MKKVKAGKYRFRDRRNFDDNVLYTTVTAMLADGILE